jgi:hypothetical protein
MRAAISVRQRKAARGIQIVLLFEKYGDSGDFIAKMQSTRYWRLFQRWRHPQRLLCAREL